jgi:hypothetical protein
VSFEWKMGDVRRFSLFIDEIFLSMSMRLLVSQGWHNQSIIFFQKENPPSPFSKIKMHQMSATVSASVFISEMQNTGQLSR